MRSVFRATTVATALSALACGASAETISITFDSLVDPAGPAAVTEVKGFKVGGAYAYDLTVLKATGAFFDDIEVDFPNTFTGGFLLNRDATNSSSKPSRIGFSIPDILLMVAQSGGTSYAGRFISSLTYSSWGLGAVGVDGCSTACSDSGTTSSGGSGLWSALNDRTFKDPEVTRVEFFAKDDALFGLRELNITLTDSVPGTSVPEPGSYALVGLALLAAGAATRRRS